MKPLSIAVAVVSLMLVAALGWMFGPGAAWWLGHVDGVSGLQGKDLATAVDAVRGRTLAVATGLAALIAVYYTARNADTARQGHVTDRHTKAIEQLGSEKLDVRLGGIYALERIARDSARDHPVIMEVLAVFLREHSHDEDARSESGFPLRADLQAAFQVIGRRNASHDTNRLNLIKADLRGASMVDVDLAATDLPGADLTRAALPRANMSDANLRNALLTGAQLIGAKLTKARLQGADLSGADLQQADLRGADLREAKLSGALLEHANLRGATLRDADLTDTDLSYADLREAVGPVDLSVANTHGARGLPIRAILVSPTGRGIRPGVVVHYLSFTRKWRVLCLVVLFCRQVRGHHVSGPASGDLPRLPIVRTARVDEAAFAEAEPGQVSADSPPVDHKTDAHKFVGDPLRGPLVLAAPGLDLLKLKMPISAATWAMGRVWHRFTSRLRPSTLRGAFAWGTRRPLEVRQRQARHLSCAPAALWPFSPSVRPGYGSRQDRLRGRSARTPHHEARAGS